MVERKKSVVGVGHCCQDLICTVEAYPPEDGSTHITAMDGSQGGGAVATALVAASRLGTPAGVIANLGTDGAGESILRGFEREGVDTRGVRRVEGISSQSIVMVNPANGSRTKFPCRDSLAPIPFDEEQRRQIGEAAVLHLDGTRWDNAMAAAAIAREAGVTVSLDGCSRQADNERNLRLAAMADILIMNAVYPFKVSGRENPEEALRFMAAQGVQKRVVMMTRGSEGSLALIDGRVEAFPAFRVEAVDTTGAGDVFHGAFLSEWLLCGDVRRCIRFASAVSALKCLRTGGRQGIPTRAEAERFLASLS